MKASGNKQRKKATGDNSADRMPGLLPAAAVRRHPPIRQAACPTPVRPVILAATDVGLTGQDVPECRSGPAGR